MDNSWKVLGKGQGTFRMDRERTRFHQEERRDTNRQKIME